MNDDFENRLATLLGEQVDHEAGPRRPAPPLAAPTRARHGRRAPWVAPLLAAACVAAVVAGGYGASELSANHKSDPAVPRPPIRSLTGATLPSPTGSPSTGSGVRSSASPPPSAHATGRPLATRPPATRPPATHPAPPAAGTHPSTNARSSAWTATIEGARIRVPAGWELYQAEPSADDPGSITYTRYCLRPEDEPGACIINLAHVHLPTGTIQPYQSFDVDWPGFDQSTSAGYSCADGATVQTTEHFGERVFGGRAADYHEWIRRCGSRVVGHEFVEVANAAPGWALALTDPTPASQWATDRAVLDQVAAKSALPAATGPLRLMDRGQVTAAAMSGDTVRLTLRRMHRVWRGDDTTFTTAADPGTVTYLVPSDYFVRTGLKVGDETYVATNGHRVIMLRREYL